MHQEVMGSKAVLGEVVTKVTAAGFPINDKLALLFVVLDSIEAHVNGCGFFCLIVSLAKPSAVELSTRIGVGGCGCPSSVRVVRIGSAF